LNLHAWITDPTTGKKPVALVYPPIPVKSTVLQWLRQLQAKPSCFF
jgi:hypothetical protein